MSYSYGGRRGFGFNRSQPVEVDKEYEARIEDISRRGDGSQKSKDSSYLCQTLSKENKSSSK